MRRALLLLIAGLAACGPMPEVPLAPADLAAPPVLVPIGGLLAQADALAGLASPGPALAVQADALAARTQATAAPRGGADDARAAALAARAAALRAPVLAPEDRARLARDDAGPGSLQ